MKEVSVTDPFAQWAPGATQQNEQQPTQVAPQQPQGWGAPAQQQPAPQGWGQPQQAQQPQGWGAPAQTAPPVQQSANPAPQGWGAPTQQSGPLQGWGQPQQPTAPAPQPTAPSWGAPSGGTSGMMFGDPVAADRVRQNNLVDHLVLIFPKSVDEERRNRNGQPAPQMTADVVVLGHAERGPIPFEYGGNPTGFGGESQTPNPHSKPAPHRFSAVWLSGPGILNKCRAFLPGGEMRAKGVPCVLGVIRLGQQKPGQSRPYFLEAATDNHKAFAQKWMEGQAASMVGGA